MTITVFSENDQQTIVGDNNQGKKNFEKIPLVPRNYNTGWPLLQVSLFSAVEDKDGLAYEPALGGGRCHDVLIGAFDFAQLITKIPGKVAVAERSGRETTKDKVRLDNVAQFLGGFSVHHIGIGVKISFSHTTYGNALEIMISEGDTQQLQMALREVFAFACKPGTILQNFALWNQNAKYTVKHIKACINDEVAIFSNGQIFIDLGALLEQVVKDDDITAYLKHAFKVDEFLALAAEHPEFKPRLNIEPTSTKPKPTHPKINKEIDDPNLKHLLFKINAIRDYGVFLLENKKREGQAVISHADKLTQKVHDFHQKLSENQLDESGVNRFKAEFTHLLHEKDTVMKKHRKIWRPIVANILIALTGIGLLAITFKAISHMVDATKHKKTASFNDAFFCAKTRRQQKIEDIHEAVKSIKSTPRGCT